MYYLNCRVGIGDQITEKKNHEQKQTFNESKNIIHMYT